MGGWKETLYQAYVSSGQVKDSNAPPEAYLKPRQAYLEAVIRRHFPIDRAARILDIGCGHGALLYFLHAAAYRNLGGVDGSQEQVALARRLGIPGVEHGEGLRFLRGREAGSADVICLFDVLEHLTRQEAFDLLLEVRRVLSPAGLCIGHAPNAEGIFGARVRYGDLTHEQAFTASSLRQMFGALRFGTVRCFEDKPAVHGIKSLTRRVIWEVGTAPVRLLFAAEAGTTACVLSQNLLFVAQRHPDGQAAGLQTA
jgi:SAM-dependent methyltransferase